MDKPQNIIGPQLRKLRYERGLTQEQFAAQLSVKGFAITRGTLSKIEAQVRCVTDREVDALARAAKVPLQTLFSMRSKA